MARFCPECGEPALAMNPAGFQCSACGTSGNLEQLASWATRFDFTTGRHIGDAAPSAATDLPKGKLEATETRGTRRGRTAPIEQPSSGGGRTSFKGVFVGIVAVVSIGFIVFGVISALRGSRVQDVAAEHVIRAIIPKLSEATDTTLSLDDLRELDFDRPVLVLGREWGMDTFSDRHVEYGRAFYPRKVNRKVLDDQSRIEFEAMQRRYEETAMYVIVMRGFTRRDDFEYPDDNFHSLTKRNVDLDAAVFEWPQQVFLGNLRVTMPFFSDLSEKHPDSIPVPEHLSFDEHVWGQYDDDHLLGLYTDSNSVNHLTRLLQTIGGFADKPLPILETDQIPHVLEQRRRAADQALAARLNAAANLRAAAEQSGNPIPLASAERIERIAREEHTRQLERLHRLSRPAVPATRGPARPLPPGSIP